MTNPRDALTAHLDYFAELGVDGVRVESTWRQRATNGPQLAAAPLPGATEPEEMVSVDTVQVFMSPMEALAAIREDLGDCTRCKLHGLGRQTDRATASVPPVPT